MSKTTFRLMSIFILLTLTIGRYFNAQASTISSPLTATKTYYVAVNGIDSNACTSNAPCKTFNKVITLAQAGDVINILPGTYTQSLTITKSGLTIIGNGAILNALGQEHGVSLAGKNLTVLNVVVTNSTSHGIFVTGQNVRVANSEVYNAVLECAITGSFCGSALKVDAPGDGVVFENNYVHNNPKEGINITRGKNVTVINNRVSNNKSVEIYVDNSSNVRVENNHIFCNQLNSTGIAFDEEVYPSWGQQLSNLYIGRNSINGCNRGLGYWATQGGIKSALIEYNTLYNIKSSTLYFASGNNSNVVIAHNIFSNTQPWFDGKTGISIDNNFWISTKPTAATGALGPHDKAGTPTFATTPLWTDSTTLKQLPTSLACGYGRWDCENISIFARFTPVRTSTSPGISTMTPSPNKPVLIAPTMTEAPATVTPMAILPIASPTSMLPVPAVQPASEVVFNDKNSNFVYSPGWTDVSRKQAYGHSYKQTTQNGAFVTFTFTGKSFSILYKSGSSFGKMDVYVDNILVGTINENTKSASFQRSWDYTGRLILGTHTLKLVFVTTDTSNNTMGSVDAVIVR